MKTKFCYLTLSVIILLFAFSACSNSEDPENVDNTKSKSVFLKLGKSTSSTRSVTAPVADGSSVVLETGDLYFVNASGAILKHYTITSSISSPTNINIGDANSGTSIANLPGNTEAVYVVGNTTGLPTTGNISTVKEFLLSVENQNNIERVNLYGTGALVDPVSPSLIYTCELDLSPTLARIQLANITSAGVITDFKVEGIFIDNYYSKARVDGGVSSTYFVSNGPDATAFNDQSTKYPTALKPAVYDFYNPALSAVTKIAKPAGTGTVWAYNLFATSAGSTVPRIIIRLTNIVTNDGSTYAEPQFVTIKGFKAVSGGAALTSIQSGNIYNIAAGALTFKETDLSPIPNVGSIEVQVTVNLIDWTMVGVTPEL